MEFTKEQMSKALEEAYKKAGHNAYFANGFEAGVVFAQEQFKILNIPCVSESCIEFATWLQDNYSQNKKQGSKDTLPKGYMRKDFTDNTFPISEIYKEYNSR